MENDSHNDTLTKVILDASSRLDQAVKQIESLAKDTNAVNLFVVVAAQMILRPAGSDYQIDENICTKLETLAYYLFPLFDAPTDSPVTPFHTNACIDALDALYVSQTQYSLFSEIEENRSSGPIHPAINSVKTYYTIVRGSAYPEQTADEIVSIQGKFEGWYNKRLGIGPNKAKDLLWAIVGAKEEAVNRFIPDARRDGELTQKAWEDAEGKPSLDRTDEDKRLLRMLRTRGDAGTYGFFASLNEKLAKFLPVSPDNIRHMGMPVTESEWKALCGLVGLTTQRRKTMTSPLDVR